MKKILLLILGILILSGCTKKIYVPEYHTEYIVKTDSVAVRDSIYVKDSVFVKEKGDTILIEKWKVKYVDRWKDKLVTDTIVKTDSVTIVREVEKKLTRWQKARMNAGMLFFGMVLLLIGYGAYKIWRKVG